MHTLASRPHVFPASGQVHVRLGKPKECLLVMDGQHESTLKGTEYVVLTASERRAKFIRFRDDFYRRIEEKVSRQGGRPMEGGTAIARTTLRVILGAARALHPRQVRGTRR